MTYAALCFAFLAGAFTMTATTRLVLGFLEWRGDAAAAVACVAVALLMVWL